VYLEPGPAVLAVRNRSEDLIDVGVEGGYRSTRRSRVEDAKKDMFIHLGMKRRDSRCWIEVAAFRMSVSLFLMPGLRLIE
jgi:hypothetical protein